MYECRRTVSEARRRRGVPDRWLLPPEPSERELAHRWRSLGFDQRRTLARVSPHELHDLPPQECNLVVGLARRRLATAWRLWIGAAVLGWLMLMTVWGFGRSTYPGAAQTWLLAGAVLGALLWLVASVHAARRVRRARQIVTAGQDGPSCDPMAG